MAQNNWNQFAQEWTADEIAAANAYFSDYNNVAKFNDAMGRAQNGQMGEGYAGRPELPEWAYDSNGAIKPSLLYGGLTTGFTPASSLEDPYALSEWQQRDPSFNPANVAQTSNPVFGNMVNLSDLPEGPDTTMQDILEAIATVGGGALGINSLLGVGGLLRTGGSLSGGLSSLLNDITGGAGATNSAYTGYTGGIDPLEATTGGASTSANVASPWWDASGNALGPTASAVGTGLGTTGLGSTLGSALGSAGASGLSGILGPLISSGVGAYAANSQSNALEDMAARYEGYGAPYRQKLSDLYANPDSFLTSKEVTTPVDQGTQSLMRSLSMTGNPFGSGNALQQGQSYASDQLFSKLGQEKDRLAGFGGLSNYNAAAPAATTNAINSTANMWNALGSGASNIFNPVQNTNQTLTNLLRSLNGGT